MLLYATKDTYTFTAKYTLTEVQKRSQEISLHIAVTSLHIFRVFEAQRQACSFSTHFAQSSRNFSQQMTMNSSIKVMVVTVNHWHFVFRRVQGKVTKEGMLLKTSTISAAAGALLLLALLRLHGRASLDSCSSRTSRDHKARTGHL